jgi:general secretion pathway protein L
LIWSDAQGVSTLPLEGGFARARLAAHTGPVQWTAEPAAVAATEQWLGHSVPVRTRQQHLSQALKAPWDLRQNELAPRLRGAQALQHLAHRLRQPEWRAWRWGMAALIGVQVFGLNALALQQHRQEQSRQQAIQTMLAQAFPQIPGADVSRVPASLSALRTAAGVAAGDDLEPLLGAAARHWPTEVGPVQAVDYEAGRLTLVAPDWRDELTPAFGQALAADGIQLQQDSSRLVLQLAGGTR